MSTGNTPIIEDGHQNTPTQGSLCRHPGITQGAYVGLRYVWLGRSWLAGWPTNHVQKATCPGVYFSGNKPKHCGGEIFQIFGQRRGSIKVGDKVALYYSGGRKWLVYNCNACNSHYCGIYPCPGTPTYNHGFQDHSRWRCCWGEVFKIAVMNKKKGRLCSTEIP